MISKALKGTKEWDLFVWFWKVHQQAYICETDEDWQWLVDENEKIYKAYKGTELEMMARELILVNVHECERKSKKVKN